MSKTQITKAGKRDVDAIAAFVGGLSLRTRYLRFFTGAAPSSAVMRLLAGSGGADVLVAICEGGLVVGHAIAVDTVGPPVLADIGVVVADAWQGRGVGSALLRALIARARVRGATGLTMSVLPENRRVLAMIAGHWPTANLRVQPDSVTFSAPIWPAHGTGGTSGGSGGGGPVHHPVQTGMPEAVTLYAATRPDMLATRR